MTKQPWIVHLYRSDRSVAFLCGTEMTFTGLGAPHAHVTWYINPDRGNFGKALVSSEKICEACAARVTPLDLLAGTEL